MSYVAWMHRGKLQRLQVGGKGAALSDLLAGGFSVPPGFCITADAYRYFCDEAGLNERIRQLLGEVDPAQPGSARETTERIRALIAEAPLPQELHDAIVEAYNDLAAMVGLACAVRSSAVSEDGAEASFAGLYESYLNVRGAHQVLEAVRRCYVSLWSERAVSYRAMRTNGGDEAMAVVVMGLVPSETSGVAFTAHPVTGDREQVVINASFGLGEAIVSGRVTPDSFVIAKGSFALIERGIYPKELAIYPHPDGGGTIERKLDPARQTAPSLTDEQACQVARLAARVESHFGFPQDVEWALSHGDLFLLQSRPITTLG